MDILLQADLPWNEGLQRRWWRASIVSDDQLDDDMVWSH